MKSENEELREEMEGNVSRYEIKLNGQEEKIKEIMNKSKNELNEKMKEIENLNDNLKVLN